MKYLICATPRSATGYMSVLFTSAGIDCGHEKVFLPKKIRYSGKQGEASWMAAPYLQRLKTKTRIIHITRDPIQVISSLKSMKFFYRGDMDYENFIYKHLPEVQEYESIEKYTYFWTYWNRMIQKHTRTRYRIEDINEDKEAIFKRLKIKIKGELYDNQQYNSQGEKKLITLEEIPNGEVKKQFMKTKKLYGY